ncbi:MAG TPA: Ig-like domain-containing protein, partial [Nocardioidaceae bacterium]|nr:Ig-like domain-containing protein [Nocardioidaceae bacterium]
NFVGSTSAGIGHTVNPANTQLTITSDDPEPSDPNETVTVKWTLSPTGAGAGTPTGTVTVGAGAGVTPCSVPATFGTSSCDLVFPTSGNKTINASYSGDANFNGSNDNEPHTVTTPNVPPTAGADGYSTDEDVSLIVNAANGVLKNDNDSDHGPQGLQARNFSTPAHGSLNGHADGSFTYTPDADFNGTDSFTYEAFDGAASAQATVTITVDPVNDAPSFTSGGDVSVTGATTFSQGWATNASPGPANESGQALTYVVSFDPNFPLSSLLFDEAPSVAPDGTLSFKTNGFVGVAHMIVHLEDDGGTANGGVDTSGDLTFTITVN